MDTRRWYLAKESLKAASKGPVRLETPLAL